MTSPHDYIQESLHALAAFADDAAAAGVVARVAAGIAGSLRSGGKLLLCGNGGSAGDAQHIAGEFVGRLFYDRAPLPAVALGTDGAVLTALANDYGYEHVFARQVRGLGHAGDVLLALSTSGNSPSVLRALEAAAERQMLAFGFTGAGGGDMAPLCAELLRAPSGKTSVIQQIHMVAAHAICGVVERELFPPLASAG